jgi:hypothetical protein
MLDLSLAGLLGAFIGTAVAAVVYAPLVSALERLLLTSAPSENSGEGGRNLSEQDACRQEKSLFRRVVLAADIVAFAGFGYWLAATLAG